MRLASIVGAALLAAGTLLGFGEARAQGAPVKIGVITDMTGVLSAVSGEGSVEGARMAIEDFGGSVLGQKIELLSGAHLGKPDVASAIARRWIDQEGVDVVMDFVSSAVAIAVQNV